MNRLSLQFQEAHVDFDSLAIFVDGTKRALNEKKKFKVEVSKTLADLEKLQVNVNVDEEKQNKFMARVKGPFLDRLVDNISERFANTDIMAAFAHFVDKSNYSADKQKVLSSSVAKLTEQFGVSDEEAQPELFDFVSYVQSGVLKDNSVAEVLVLPKFNNMFPSLSNLAKAYKVQPPHTADCDRDFSRMALIKTELRNRMGQVTLDCLMRIAIEGPDIGSFPFTKAVKHWASKKERRYRVKVI